MYNTLDFADSGREGLALMDSTRLNIAPTGEGLSAVSTAFDAFSVAHELPHPVVHAGQIALDELLSNTVRAGFLPGEPGHIVVDFFVSEDTLGIDLTDDGIAFDPLARADPDTRAPLETRPIGGLGIYFVKQLMDSVEYERVDGKNHLRLRKRIIRSS